MSRQLEDQFSAGKALREARVDRGTNRINDVALLGQVSENGRVYSDDALRDAVRLYEGVAFYLDHPPRSEMKERDGVRSVRDLAGRVTNPRRAGRRVRGDLELLEAEPTRTLVLSVAEQMPDLVGNSHRATGRVRVRDDGTQVVETLEQVEAVELVTEPATTDSLFESVERNVRERRIRQRFQDAGIPEDRISNTVVVSIARMSEGDRQEAVRGWIRTWHRDPPAVTNRLRQRGPASKSTEREMDRGESSNGDRPHLDDWYRDLFGTR